MYAVDSNDLAKTELNKPGPCLVKWIDTGDGPEPRRYTPQAVASVARSQVVHSGSEWPEMPEAAFHGPAGEFVHLVDPVTESDPNGLLVQLLTAVGNMVGRGPFVKTDSDRQHMNLFMVLVGASSKGRKGQAGRRSGAWRKTLTLGGLNRTS